MTQDLEVSSEPWSRAAGVELLGAVSGSGINHATFLIKRPDGQVIQLTELLYVILTEATKPLRGDQLAEVVSAKFGRELDVEGLELLAQKKLEPLGLLEHPGRRRADSAPAAKPLFALSAKATLIPRSVVGRLSYFFQPLFAPPIVALACAALVVLDVRLFTSGNIGAALKDVLTTPTMLLSFFALTLAGSLFHELGHASACRYGGATPGVIGVGIYVVMPAFYTDVTDSYRLGRAGRIRTDLGGIYFHLLWTLSAGASYLITKNPMMLLLALMTQLQMAQQLPPMIRLDGYFVLADLAGVPDLFSRVGPVLRSLVPGRPWDPRVLELRPLSRRIVTGWVLLVVPLLAVLMVWLVVSLPFVIVQTALAIAGHAQTLALALAADHPAEAVLALLAIALLAIPVTGGILITSRLAIGLMRGMRARFARSAPNFPPNPAAPRLQPRHIRSVQEGDAVRGAPAIASVQQT